MIKTSVIIPVKDDDYIFTCLESLFPQINSTREIIVVNDFLSSENFSQKLKSFCKKNRVRYFVAKKPGASANRNLGMKLARGGYILFIDSDCRSKNNWINSMEKSLAHVDIVEGTIFYDSKERTILDRVVENKETLYRFLTANLGIVKKVARTCKFDDRFIVFREDTDFGLSALEKGFKSCFDKRAIVFHRRAKFSLRRFITERKRYIGEALFFKKHYSNKIFNQEVRRIGRILYPFEFLFIIGIIGSLILFQIFLPFFYFFPGAFYIFKKLKQGYSWNTYESIAVLFLLPVTMLVKRIAIWKGAIRFKVFII